MRFHLCRFVAQFFDCQFVGHFFSQKKRKPLFQKSLEIVRSYRQNFVINNLVTIAFYFAHE